MANVGGRVCHGEQGLVEVAMLYVMVREARPARVLEIGSLCGWSSL